MTPINTSPLSYEVPQCFRSMISNDRTRDVSELETLADDLVLQRRFVNQRATVDGVQHAPERNSFAQLRFAKRKLVMYIPKDVHGVADDAIARIGWNWSGSSHANGRVGKRLNEAGQRTGSENHVATQNHDERFGGVAQQHVESACLS